MSFKLTDIGPYFIVAGPWLGVLVGLVFTALVQSCSVTTGLAILIVEQGILPAAAAIPIVMGANIEDKHRTGIALLRSSMSTFYA